MEEQFKKVRKWAARRARLEIFNQMNEASKERFRKKDILTYSRGNKAPSSPPPPAKIVSLPPPPLVHDSPLQPAPSNEDLHLNINVPNMIGKMNMEVSVVEM